MYHGPMATRVVVAITGSTGAIYGVRLLEQLKEIPEVESHLVMSAPGKRTLVEETDFTVKYVEGLAHVVYDNRDIGAPIASGSFKTFGMVIAPCSIKTVSSLANCYSSTLIARAGDVSLKEGRRLIALVRESPLHAGHLKQLLALARLGAVVLPPVPAFYTRPKTLDDIVNHTVGRALDRLGLPQRLVPEWTGTGQPRK
jgi:4-hydroxy-3-polyprenylbenzoate decarboxylase